MKKSSVQTAQKGFAHTFIIVVALAILAVAAYLFLQSKNPGSMMRKETVQEESMMEDEKMMDADEVSESTKTDVIESELDSTTVGSIDSDIDELEVDASSL